MAFNSQGMTVAELFYEEVDDVVPNSLLPSLPKNTDAPSQLEELRPHQEMDAPSQNNLIFAKLPLEILVLILDEHSTLGAVANFSQTCQRARDVAQALPRHAAVTEMCRALPAIRQGLENVVDGGAGPVYFPYASWVYGDVARAMHQVDVSRCRARCADCRVVTGLDTYISAATGRPTCPPCFWRGQDRPPYVMLVEDVPVQAGLPSAVYRSTSAELNTGETGLPLIGALFTPAVHALLPRTPGSHPPWREAGPGSPPDNVVRWFMLSYMNNLAKRRGHGQIIPGLLARGAYNDLAAQRFGGDCPWQYRRPLVVVRFHDSIFMSSEPPFFWDSLWAWRWEREKSAEYWMVGPVEEDPVVQLGVDGEGGEDGEDANEDEEDEHEEDENEEDTEEDGEDDDDDGEETEEDGE